MLRPPEIIKNKDKAISAARLLQQEAKHACAVPLNTETYCVAKNKQNDTR